MRAQIAAEKAEARSAADATKRFLHERNQKIRTQKAHSRNKSASEVARSLAQSFASIEQKSSKNLEIVSKN
jgi:hypothetical protein